MRAIHAACFIAAVVWGTACGLVFGFTPHGGFLAALGGGVVDAFGRLARSIRRVRA